MVIRARCTFSTFDKTGKPHCLDTAIWGVNENEVIVDDLETGAQYPRPKTSAKDRAWRRRFTMTDNACGCRANPV